MNDKNAHTLNAESILENVTRTLLYEGYALYPYHRSAVKNQKPVPFGVIFPENYNAHNVYAHSQMQTQCIVTGTDEMQINFCVRFLHLQKITLFERTSQQEIIEDNFIPVYSLNLDGKSYQAGWQTIERKVNSEDMRISELIKNRKDLPFKFDQMNDSKYIYDENGEIAANQINSVIELKGMVRIEASRVNNMLDAFQVTVSITNTTPVENAETVTRDEVLSQSLLSTNTILNTPNGQFISHQNPGEKWTSIIAECQNKNTWPILIDESNTTLLSSPIILYDYPQINPQSSGDLFDSTEIEEALLLHVAVLSDDEKNRIAQSDEKLRAMLSKVNQVTPEELINFHSGLKHTAEYQINNKKISEI